MKNPIWKIFISYMIILTLLIFPNIKVNAQVVVTHFNADWNASNDVEWFNKLSDCELSQVDIVKDPKLQKKHEIVVVPTIIIFKDGEEVKRFQADISFTMKATRKEIQEIINEQNLSDF
tara:strand:+ start:904 stop:1260 length:357 start_codon:yes stop_codon:yes gene_type:complete